MIRQAGNVNTGFGRAIGCMMAVAFVFVGIPLLLWAGCSGAKQYFDDKTTEQMENVKQAKERADREAKERAEKFVGPKQPKK